MSRRKRIRESLSDEEEIVEVPNQTKRKCQVRHSSSSDEEGIFTVSNDAKTNKDQKEVENEKQEVQETNVYQIQTTNDKKINEPKQSTEDQSTDEAKESDRGRITDKEKHVIDVIKSNNGNNGGVKCIDISNVDTVIDIEENALKDQDLNKGIETREETETEKKKKSEKKYEEYLDNGSVNIVGTKDILSDEKKQIVKSRQGTSPQRNYGQRTPTTSPAKFKEKLAVSPNRANKTPMTFQEDIEVVKTILSGLEKRGESSILSEIRNSEWSKVNPDGSFLSLEYFKRMENNEEPLFTRTGHTLRNRWAKHIVKSLIEPKKKENWKNYLTEVEFLKIQTLAQKFINFTVRRNIPTIEEKEEEFE